MDLDIPSDSTFLKCALEFLHKDNLPSLINKTVTGKETNVLENGILKRVTIKECISPQKTEILRELFNERIGSLTIEQMPHRRRKRFHSVLAKALDRLRVDRLKFPRAKKKLQFDVEY